MTLAAPRPLETLPFDDAVAEPNSSVRRLHAFLVRRWLTIGFTVVLVLFATAAVLRTLTPRYTAHAEVLLDPQRERPLGPDTVLHVLSLDNADIESAIALIRGGALLRRVVAVADLGHDPEFTSAQSGAEHQGWASAFTRRPKPLEPADEAAATLWRMLKVERIGKSFALGINVTSVDPDKAARLTNATAEAFVTDQRDARLEASRLAATFFADRLGPLGDRLRRSESALEQFRRDHNLMARTASVDAGASTINEQQLAELNSRLVNAQAETAHAWARYSQAQAVERKGGALESIPDVLRSNLIVQLRQQQAEVVRKEADLAARYSDGYPLLVNVRAERRELERAIAREIARVLATLKGEFDVAKSQEDSLRASVAVTTGAAGLDSDLGPRLRELERQTTADQTLFETYLAKAREAEQQASFDTHDVRIISPAGRPSVPAYPQRWLAAACMSVFGLGLGIGIGLLLDALSPGFSSPRQAEAALGVAVIAAVPWLNRRDRVVEGRPTDPSRYLANRPHSPYAESIHCLRAGVRTSSGEPARVVLFTSAGPGEGKTAMALSFAVSAARAGQRVLLLDADLRSPALSRSFDFEHRLGLVDMLIGLVGADETTVALGGGLAIMPSGRRTAVAPDLFASGRMALYVQHVRGAYDLVVVDAAPCGIVVDARVLAELADRIVFVVGWRRTACEVVARNLQVLGHADKLAGIVLNKVDERRMPYGADWARAFHPTAQRMEA